MTSTPSLHTLFWETLENSGLCNDEVIDQVRQEIELSRRQPLGSVLVRRGLISVSQIACLLSIQAEEPDMRIGDLAVREGYCTAIKVGDALKFQRSQWRTPLECLSKNKDMDAQDLVQVLVAYMEKLESIVRYQQEEERGNRAA